MKIVLKPSYQKAIMLEYMGTLPSYVNFKICQFLMIDKICNRSSNETPQTTVDIIISL